MEIFEIQSEDVAKFDDKQLHNLLEQLLYLESDQCGLRIKNIYVNEETKTPDGGIDGEIELYENPINSNWIQSKNIIFQCKAEKITLTRGTNNKIEELFRKKDSSIQPDIKKMLDNGGQYILFISKFTSKTCSAIKTAEELLHEVATNLYKGNYSRNQFRVYDANKIKNWSNKFLSLTLRQLNYIGKRIPIGLEPLTFLRKDPKLNKPKFQTNESLIKLIKIIEENHKISKYPLRIRGNMGIGKTRLVYEAIRQEGQISQVENACYFRISHESSASEIINFFKGNYNRYEITIVVDNCDSRTHEELCRYVTRDDSKMRLITINDKLDRVLDCDHSDTKYIDLNQEVMRGVNESILEAEAGVLDYSAKTYYLKFSDGYPQMLIWCLEKQDIATKLKEPSRFLGFGYNQLSEETQSIIGACSIFSRFPNPKVELFANTLDSDNKKRIEEQLTFICNELIDTPITLEKFKNAYRLMKQWDMVDSDDRLYMSIKPLLLRLSLAARYIENCGPDKFKKLYNKFCELGLENLLCENLQDLNQLPEISNIVKGLFGAQSPFVSAKELNTESGSRLFRTLIHVDPDHMLNILEDALKGFSLNDLKKKFSRGRRNIVWALEKTCFIKEHFEMSTKILLRLAAAESENFSNNATGTFLHLFEVYLSGTEASLLLRLKVIDHALNDQEFEYKKLGIKALGRCLKTSHFMRTPFAEFQGMNKPLRSYEPSFAENIEYWQKALDRLTKFACETNDSELKDLTLQQIAHSGRGLFTYAHQGALLNVAISKIMEKMPTLFWQGMLRELKIIEDCDKSALNSEEIKLLEVLINKLTLDTLESKITRIVSQPFAFMGRFNQQEVTKNVEIFAHEFIADQFQKLTPYLSLLLQGRHTEGYTFGQELGRINNDPIKAAKLMISVLDQIPQDQQNLVVFAGFINTLSINIQDQVLELIFKTQSILRHSVYLAMATQNPEKYLDALFKFADENKVTAEDFLWVRSLFIKDGINTDLVIKTCKIISNYQHGGLVALNLISGYLYRYPEKLEEFRSLIKEIFFKNNILAEEGYISSYAVFEMIKNLLNNETDNELAGIIIKHLVDIARDGSYIIHSHGTLGEFLNILPLQYFDTFFSILSKYFLDKNNINEDKCLDIYGIRDTFGKVIFANQVHFEKVYKWVIENRSSARIIAKYIQLYDIKDQVRVWNRNTLKVIEEFGDEEGFLDALYANLMTKGFSGFASVEYQKDYDILAELIEQEVISEKAKIWIKEALKNIDNMIKREKLHEAF